MKKFKAYCRYCQTVVDSFTKSIMFLESGNYLYTGDCPACLYEVRRIATPKENLDVN